MKGTKSMMLSNLMEVIDKFVIVDVYEMYESDGRQVRQSFYKGAAWSITDMPEADVVSVYDYDGGIRIRVNITTGWVCTDADEMQYQRRISEDLYEMYGIFEVNGSEYVVNHKLLRVSNIKRHALYYLYLYGYNGDGDWRDILIKSHNILPEMCEPLLIEMAFETTRPDDDAPTFDSPNDAAREIRNAIAASENA